MIKKFKDLPLRIGVGIAVLNKKNQVFLAKRIDNPKNFWQMPQGGVDEGENFYNAAIRELEEETSIKTISLIKEIEKSKLQDLLKVAEEETNKPEINDQSKYLVDQKIEVLKSLN